MRYRSLFHLEIFFQAPQNKIKLKMTDNDNSIGMLCGIDPSNIAEIFSKIMDYQPTSAFIEL